MHWRPSKNESVSIWCSVCNQYRTRSRVDGHCIFCRDGRLALILIKTADGIEEYPCFVLSETPKYYRIIVYKPTKIPPSYKILQPKIPKMVSKSFIRIV